VTALLLEKTEIFLFERRDKLTFVKRIVTSNFFSKDLADGSGQMVNYQSSLVLGEQIMGSNVPDLSLDDLLADVRGELQQRMFDTRVSIVVIKGILVGFDVCLEIEG
jgi:hypothetical protein